MNKQLFFSQVRTSLFGGKLAQKQVDGLNAILHYATAKISDSRQIAYILATAYHETDKTMQPVEEYGKGAKKKYGKKVKYDGTHYTYPNHIYYGRGLVQITWYDNYESIGRRIGVDLINNPEKALELDISVVILVEGMIGGWFTGKRLSGFFKGDKADPRNARRIINGTDKAALISGYYGRFLTALNLAAQ